MAQLHSWRFLVVLASLVGLAPAVSAGGMDDPRVDPKTGAELMNYPPDRHFDHLHMLLELDIPDMSKPFLRGVETLSVTPIGRDRGTLDLDAGDRMSIESVSIGGRPQRFTHEGRSLVIELSPPVKLGQHADVRIAYSVDYPLANGTGLTWTPGRENATSPTDRVPQIHSQGQPGYNHTWFACHDFPNERLTTELVVTVEDGFIVGSNGRLVNTRYAGSEGGKPRTRWHWLQDKPHSAYLVSMIVGKFSIVGLPWPEGVEQAVNSSGNALCVYLYAPVGTERTAARAYANTPAMVAYFAERFDEPYPWDKYSQALVREFAAGGMENTSATTMQAGSARAGPGSQDGVISHELTHQWFGDYLTCKSWEHAWLNEGWASFGEALWEEGSTSKNKRQAYQARIAQFLSGQRMLNRTYAPLFPPMVSGRYTDPMQTFMKPNDIYAKGAIVLHMLRQGLGDDVFFKGVRNYIDRHKLETVETDDFRHCLEEASGLNLERFFEQWCYRPGLPRLNVELEWKESQGGGGGGELVVVIDQAQRIDADNPAYSFMVPVLIKGESGPGVYRYVDVDAKHTEASFALTAKPVDVVVDPNMLIAATTRVRKPLAMWLEQLGDESVFAQVQAAEHLAEFDAPEAAAALARVAADEEIPEVVRRAAGLALAEHHLRTLETILGEAPSPGSPRRATLALSKEEGR